MDIGVSTKVALAQRKKNSIWLAEKLDVTEGMARYHMRTVKQTKTTIAKLAEVFDITVEEFIALGESEY